MEKKHSINFHQTFYSNLEYISKILMLGDYAEFYTKEEISEITGIPTGKSSGKVVPHIKYSEYMNLITFVNDGDKYKISRTDLGELIYNEDLFIEENVTKFLCHYFLTSKSFGAPMWFDVYRYFQAEYGKKIRVGLVDAELEEKYGKKVKLNPFNGCYLNNYSFEELGLLSIEDECYMFNEFKYNGDYLYAVLFCLFKELEALDNNRREFSETEIFENLFWQKALNWDEVKGMNLLEQAEEKGILSINKQLLPVTIIMNTNSRSLLNDIYSNLI